MAENKDLALIKATEKVSDVLLVTAAVVAALIGSSPTLKEAAKKKAPKFVEFIEQLTKS
jgi:hypothetical protein